MRVISFSAVSGGGKTAVVTEILQKLPNARALYFDDFDFEGAVEDYAQWVREGADYHVWKLEPLAEAILRSAAEGNTEWLLLDYPFARLHKTILPYIDCSFFIDTPLDIALARRILRDQQGASGKEILMEMEHYLSDARAAFLQMIRDVLPTADFVVDGSRTVSKITNEILSILYGLDSQNML